jgi:hypothetical protein
MEKERKKRKEREKGIKKNESLILSTLSFSQTKRSEVV